MPLTGPDNSLTENPAAYIDHTLLKPNMTADQVACLCEEAVEYGFSSVCLPPAYVARAADLLYGSSVATCTVVGFPCGYTTVRQKVLETAEVVALGATEVDMVVSIGNLLAGDLKRVEDEISQVVLAAEGQPVKVIIECCYLTQELMRQATNCCLSSGAAFVKTSTGFGPGGARVEDVRLLANVAANRLGVKAAGGIRDLMTCETMFAAGATRIGTSSGVAIVQQWQSRQLD